MANFVQRAHSMGMQMLDGTLMGRRLQGESHCLNHTRQRTAPAASAWQREKAPSLSPHGGARMHGQLCARQPKTNRADPIALGRKVTNGKPFKSCSKRRALDSSAWRI